MENHPYLSATLTYKVRNPKGAPKECTSKRCATGLRRLPNEVQVHYHRLEAASAIAQALKLVSQGPSESEKSREEAQALLINLTSTIRASSSSTDERIQALL